MPLFKLILQSSPGASKDDEVLYGDGSQQQHGSTSGSNTAASQTTTGAHTAGHEGVGSSPDQKEHTVLGQLTNPAGDKYSEDRFGASHEGSTGAPSNIEKHLETDHSAKKHEHGVLRQIL